MLIIAPAMAADAPLPDKVDFNRDIRPLLSDNCFACHGPDAKHRKAELRLDTKAGAMSEITDGTFPIVPGDPDKSEVFKRITTTERDDMMPPAKSGKELDARQKALIKKWIEQGAPWAEHWAFIAPRRPALPEVKQKGWVKNEIDRFILARLEAEGLKPSDEAEKAALARRATQDVTGLPPTPEEIDRFLADKSPEAYEKLVDRLLDSPRYGERMALDWLDAARFADTHGFHIDSQRDMWPWRDWVIRAFNKNLPFDQFTVEQLAGDLMGATEASAVGGKPSAVKGTISGTADGLRPTAHDAPSRWVPSTQTDRLIASGFNRNHCINFEGGAFPDEYLHSYIVDRVSTTATVWMGLTMGCAQCHDHKYDPITQKEFYQFYAFFNRVPEAGLDGRDGNAKPFFKAPSPVQQDELDALAKQVAAIEAKRAARAKDAEPAALAWARETAAKQGESAGAAPADMAAHYLLDEGKGDTVKTAAGKSPDGKFKGKVEWAAGKLGGALKFNGNENVALGDAFIFDREDKVSFGCWVNPASAEHMAPMSRMNDGNSFRGWDLYLGGNQIYIHIVHQWESNAIRVNTKTAPIKLNEWQHVFVTYDGSSKAEGVKIFLDGKPQELVITHNALTGTIAVKTPAHIGSRNPGAKLKGLVDDVRFYARQLSDAEAAAVAGSDPIKPILAKAQDKWSPLEKQAIVTHYLQTHDAEYRKLADEVAAIRKKEAAIQAAIPTVMVMSDEANRDTHIRLRGEYDKLGEKVSAGLPAALPASAGSGKQDRLALARWLTAPAHPLTARVQVNRMWAMHFGTGIVRTVEDFGAQGEPPTHPELLDWLADEFVRSGWDMKHLRKLMLMSAAYRQSSRVTPEVLAKDPENRLYARGPRFRLQAELIRDQALFVSGLLVEKVGGPSVKPYQPPGLWEEVAYGGGTAGFTAGKFEQDHGEALYRKSMYTFWKRTSPPPALNIFDAPEREFCVVRRSRTNTPLQALVLMNDVTYVEASRKFAERILKEGGASVKDRITFAARWALSRPPRPAELTILTAAYEKALTKYRADNAAVEMLLAVGESPRDKGLDAAELAAWTMVANTLLNLDEVMTKN